MKVRFNGVLESKPGGCVPCGRKRASKSTMTTKKEYILPSGTRKTFYIGRVEEVSDADGEFLLQYETNRDGLPQSVFTKVK